MKIKTKLFIMFSVIIIPIVLFFSVSGYMRHKEIFLSKIDEKLYSAVIFLREMLPEDYHDNLQRNSFTEDEYAKTIVDKNNKLCKALGLQYLWSCMIIENNILFTTSTSPSYDFTQKDHARFFEVHKNPAAFDNVFATMEADYSSFSNEWGQGRMVLIPYKDKNGRPYCFGASISVDEIYASLRQILLIYTFITFFIIILIVIISNKFSEYITSYRNEERIKLEQDKNMLEKVIENNTADLQLALKKTTIFYKFAEATKEGFGMADLDGNLTYLNQSLCDFLGASTPQELIGTNVRDYYTEKDKPILENKILPNVVQTGHQLVEMPLVAVDGRVTNVTQSIFLIRDDADQPFCFANVISDISDRKMFEEEMKNKADELQRINDAFVGREKRMVELKNENKELKAEIERLKK